MTHTTRLFAQSLLAVVLFAVVALLLEALPFSQRLLLAAVLALAASYAVAYVRGSRHTRVLRELRDAARGLAAGDLTARPALADSGELGDLADALHRVTEQLGARIQALQSEDALLGALIESLNEGVLAIDARQQVVRINRAGRDLLDLGDVPVPIPADRLPRDAPLHRAIQSGLKGISTDPAEVDIGQRKLALTATPLPGGNGGAVIALFDLTQLRRLEKVRRDFVANVSHELRTPLTVVSGFAETLAEDDVPPEQRRQFAETIRSHTARMQRVVDDLLDLSRIESGGWVPNPEPLDLKVVGAEVVAAAAPAARSKGIDLRLEIADSVPRVEGDRTAVRQILTNLVENSLRHTDTGHIAVFAQEAEDGVWLGVRDTGTGIAPQHLPRIFERFYRPDAARARQSGGTGLGLAIVKHLVEAHGGWIRAESELGRGTTVVALFPRTRPNGSSGVS